MASEKRYLSIGNLGEHVTQRVLQRLGYEVLANQDELRGGRRENPEDFVAVSPDGRYVTVNSKAAVSPRSTRVRDDGNLVPAKMAKGQERVEYYSARAGFLSPIDGHAFGQVMKVDLLNRVAQLFDLDENGAQTPVGEPMSIQEDVSLICARYPHGNIPPPNSPGSASS